MWEPFTLSSRRGIILAQEQMMRLNHKAIGTGHLLWGILNFGLDYERMNYKEDGESYGFRALESLVDVQSLMRDLEDRLSQITVESENVNDPVFTPSSKRTIELAFSEVRSLAHNYIGTEHLIAGLFRTDDTSKYDVAREILERHTALDIYRARMIRFLGVEPVPISPYDQDIGKIVYVQDSTDNIIGLLTKVKGSRFLFKDAINLNPEIVKSPEQALEVYKTALPVLRSLSEKGVSQVYQNTSEFFLSNPKIHAYALVEVANPEN